MLRSLNPSQKSQPLLLGKYWLPRCRVRQVWPGSVSPFLWCGETWGNLGDPWVFFPGSTGSTKKSACQNGILHTGMQHMKRKTSDYHPCHSETVCQLQSCHAKHTSMKYPWVPLNPVVNHHFPDKNGHLDSFRGSPIFNTPTLWGLSTLFRICNGEVTEHLKFVMCHDLVGSFKHSTWYDDPNWRIGNVLKTLKPVFDHVAM